MSRSVNIDVEYFPEGYYVATSDDVQGLVGEAGSFDELIKLVPELVEMLDETRLERGWGGVIGKPVVFNFRYALQAAA